MDEALAGLPEWVKERGATTFVPEPLSRSISSGWKWSECAWVIRIRSAASSVVADHGSMYRTRPLPFH